MAQGIAMTDRQLAMVIAFGIIILLAIVQCIHSAGLPQQRRDLSRASFSDRFHVSARSFSDTWPMFRRSVNIEDGRNPDAVALASLIERLEQ
jgi:hypothetical protein